MRRPPLRRPLPPPTAQELHVPAPVGGLNAIDAASDMPASDAVLLYNMIAAEYGLRSRLGYREWSTGLLGASDNTVRSVMPFQGSKANGATNRLFAATSAGIYDVSASGAVGAKVVTFAIQTGNAGYCTALVFNTSADRYLVVVDEENGLYVYRESDSTWVQVTQGAGATQINGVNPALLVHVTVFKNRLWFTQKDTTLGWFLGLNAIFGAASSWDFGPRFVKGGDLRGLYNWSYDAGGALDTLLCAISGGGDVAIYEGTDPTNASLFGLKGTWFVGGVPAGRRIATDNGGELLILSSLGVMSLSTLITGASIFDRKQFSTYKIANLFNALMIQYRTNRGWSLRVHPSDNALLITIPATDGQATFQLAMSLANRSWSQYGGPSTNASGLPVVSADAWDGQLYFGTADGRVCLNRDYVDNVLIADPNSYTPVQFAALTSFSNLGTARQKKITTIRPRFLSQGGALRYSAVGRYDYDLSDLPAPAGVAIGAVGQAVWGTAAWDASMWAGDYASQITPTGAVGMGVAAAVGVRGVATARTTLVGFDVLYETAGFF